MIALICTYVLFLAKNRDGTMTQKGIENEISKQLFQALNRIEKLEKKLSAAYDVIDELKREFSKKEKKYQKTISDLKKENKELKNTIDKLEKENKELKGEILRLKANNQKDSSNSSKPSSTNGYKKTITNRREPSQNKPGKPKGSPSTNLSQEKLNNFYNSGNVEHLIIEKNKTKNNKNKPYKVIKVLDIKIVKQIIEYHYFPNEDGTYNIPKEHNRAIQWGPNLKTMCVVLNNDVYNSTDGIVRFISNITNNGINLAKSTILRWNNELADKLTPEISNIEANLISAYFLNCDDSSIKINGTNYNDLCVCNDKYTRLWISEKKDRESWEDLTILSNYKGIIVKDGTDVFNTFGMFLSQCISHILRYLKGIYDFIDHNGAKKMADFLRRCIHERKLLIKQGINSYTDKQLNKLYLEYDEIFKEWKTEWMKSNKDENPVYDDERKLLARFEDEKEREEILYFLNDFLVPATNSQAETDQRNAKIKQKIGKFRSVTGANDYSIIRSCINTYKKNNVCVFDALKSALLNNPVII